MTSEAQAVIDCPCNKLIRRVAACDRHDLLSFFMKASNRDQLRFFNVRSFDQLVRFRDEISLSPDTHSCVLKHEPTLHVVSRGTPNFPMLGCGGKDVDHTEAH